MLGRFPSGPEWFLYLVVPVVPVPLLVLCVLGYLRRRYGVPAPFALPLKLSGIYIALIIACWLLSALDTDLFIAGWAIVAVATIVSAVLTHRTVVRKRREGDGEP